MALLDDGFTGSVTFTLPLLHYYAQSRIADWACGLAFSRAAIPARRADNSTFSAVLYISPGIDAPAQVRAACIALHSYTDCAVRYAFSILASMIDRAQVAVVRAAARTLWNGIEGHTALGHAVKAHSLSALADQCLLAVFR